jgi:hypothetical protein
MARMRLSWSARTYVNFDIVLQFASCLLLLRPLLTERQEISDKPSRRMHRNIAANIIF